MGQIDLVRKVALYYDEDSNGVTITEREVPEEMVDLVDEWRMSLVEAIAEEDETLLEKYLGGEELEPEELMAGIRAATISLKICPVICGSAFKNKGVQALLDCVVDYLPSPVEVPPWSVLTRIRTRKSSVNVPTICP